MARELPILTLSEMAAESAILDPVSCPNCGCKDLRKLRTEYGVHRRLVCRHCGHIVAEMFAYDPPPKDVK